MATILVVDDEPANRELFHAYLEESGHGWVDAESGEIALALAGQVKPDLILLDVMLPGLSGFDTAEQLKASTRNEFVPIILVTALPDRATRLRGLRAGADEFLTKPVDRSELTLRIGNLLALRTKEAALLRRNVELVELQRFRDEMSTMIVHDLKNPLSVMISNAEYVLSSGRVTGGDDLDALHDSKAAGERALRLLANLLDLAKLEAGRLEPQRSHTTVADLVMPIVQQRTHIAESRGISLTSTIAPALEVDADVELMGRVVENVFDNAIRYTPRGGRIAVQGDVATNAVQLRIGNSGEPIPPESRRQVFEKYSQPTGQTGRMNLGLGLYFCRLAVEAHGGRMWVEETRDLPTVFCLELPA